jgi:SPP1 gp7 family putative phage head morphogenesis protein
VGLIKSVAQQYLADVQGDVMRSVSEGRKLDDLAAALEHRHGVTKRRAALIARDQNNKATAVFERVRQQELGITKARWQHSAGGKEPRPEHVAWGREGKIYDVKEGMLQEDGKRVWPGTEINCRCFSIPLIPAWTMGLK